MARSGRRRLVLATAAVVVAFLALLAVAGARDRPLRYPGLEALELRVGTSGVRHVAVGEVYQLYVMAYNTNVSTTLDASLHGISWANVELSVATPGGGAPKVVPHYLSLNTLSNPHALMALIRLWDEDYTVIVRAVFQLPDASTVVIHEEFDCWDAGKDPPGTLVEVVSGEAGTAYETMQFPNDLSCAVVPATIGQPPGDVFATVAAVDAVEASLVQRLRWALGLAVAALVVAVVGCLTLGLLLRATNAQLEMLEADFHTHGFAERIKSANAMGKILHRDFFEGGGAMAVEHKQRTRSRSASIVPGLAPNSRSPSISPRGSRGSGGRTLTVPGIRPPDAGRSGGTPYSINRWRNEGGNGDGGGNGGGGGGGGSPRRGGRRRTRTISSGGGPGPELRVVAGTEYSSMSSSSGRGVSLSSNRRPR